MDLVFYFIFSHLISYFFWLPVFLKMKNKKSTLHKICNFAAHFLYKNVLLSHTLSDRIFYELILQMQMANM